MHFFRTTDNNLNNIALRDTYGNCRTYNDLERLSDSYLRKIKKRSFVFIMCDYNIETISFYYSMLRNDDVVCLVDKNLKYNELFFLISLYEPQFIWMERTYYIEGDFSFEIMEDFESHILVKTEYRSVEMYEELAILLFTSGSTGDNKTVRLSYENIIHNVNAIADFMNISSKDLLITTLPLNFCLAMTFCHLHWKIGGGILLNEYSVYSEEFWQTFEEFKPTAIVGVPFLLEMLDSIGFFQNDNLSLNYVVNAGGRISKEKQIYYSRALREKKIDFYIAYGQTESTGGLAFLEPSKCCEKLGSVGRPLDDMKIALKDVDENGAGILFYESKSVCLGYASSKDDLLIGNVNNYKLNTEDIAMIDKEGYIYLIGRKKRIVKIHSKRYSLDYIEEVLRKKFKISDLVCIGQDDLLKVCLCKEIDKTKIKDFIFCKFNIAKKLIDILIVNEIPRNSSGKILYVDLEKLCDD